MWHNGLLLFTYGVLSQLLLSWNVLITNALKGESVKDFLHRVMPELPEQAHERLQKPQHGLTEYTVMVLITRNNPSAIILYNYAVRIANTILSSQNINISMSLIPNAVAKLICNERFAIHHQQTISDHHTGDYGGAMDIQYLEEPHHNNIASGTVVLNTIVSRE